MSGVKRVAVTGGYGFLGWHTACRLKAVHGIVPVRLGREEFKEPERLDRALKNVDAVIHIAGINRAETDAAVEQGNVEVARTLSAALARGGVPIPVAYANSVQADHDNAYGRGKAAAARILSEVCLGPVSDVLLPNLFGEHGQPGYNSFVATFAHEIAAGREPNVTGDRLIPLMHAQQAAEHLITTALAGEQSQSRPSGEAHGVAEVRDRLRAMHELYLTGDVPPLTTQFEVDLFNTYRSYRFPQMFPMSPKVHDDQRGDLFETVRSHGGNGQAFVSTTKPGRLRGDHYHVHKVERFFVVSGEAEISLRRLLHDDVVTFRLDGGVPSYVDMPTLWAHNIRNVGRTNLITMFWSNQLLDSERPDQYPERVEETEVASK